MLVGALKGCFNAFQAILQSQRDFLSLIQQPADWDLSYKVIVKYQVSITVVLTEKA